VSKTVLVTGAAGNTGKALIQDLQKRNIQCFAGVTSVESAKRLPARTPWRLCHYGQPDLLHKAMQGITHLFLMVPFHRDMLKWAETVIEAAKAAGVQFIVRLSGLKADLDCPSKMGQLHGEIDQMVKDRDIPVSILRCNSFMRNYTGDYAPMIRKYQLISLPLDEAKMAFIDTADIGNAAANILADAEKHENSVYDLHGPELLNNNEIASILTEVTARRIIYKTIDKASARESYQKLGFTDWHIEVFESLYTFLCEGGGKETDNTLASLINREPQSFRKFAVQHKHCWIE